MRMLDEMYGEPDDDRYSHDSRSDNPEYIIASTSYKLEETYVFEADENGKITNYSEYGGLAYRFGDKVWMLRPAAVQAVFPDKYKHIKEIKISDEVHHSLYKWIGNALENDCPQLPQDTWDGGQVQEP